MIDEACDQAWPEASDPRGPSGGPVTVWYKGAPLPLRDTVGLQRDTVALHSESERKGKRERERER